jgi:hypothetical protein
MFVISFNILYKDTNKKIVLTESPYLFVNENLRPIITEIRKIVGDDFLNISEEMKIPSVRLALGMTTSSFDNDGLNNIVHFFEINASNIRELNKSLIERNLYE